jgi:nitrogen fixation protein NifU and related proteins
MSEMYTERLLDHYRHPRNKGSLAMPDPSDSLGQVLAAEEYNPLCGDRVRIETKVQEERIVDVRFDGRGCALCLGAASILTEAIEGRTLDELRGLGQEEFLAELQAPIRPARLKCALLPWMAFRRALYGEDLWRFER